ncbi:MAG: phosphate-starvation-inducible PsiE family protein [Sulfurovaceae bacterium]|nr:phosphate-starvation-inducible PsiE family protein [Sulfurovaceae bacterium]
MIENNMKTFLMKYYAVIIATGIFFYILISQVPFYLAVTLMLEFVVMIEVVRMVADFIEMKRVKLRFVIDIFIIFLTRDVIIQVTQPTIDQERILFLLLVIFIFFIFRLLSLFFSPSIISKSSQTTNAEDVE